LAALSGTSGWRQRSVSTLKGTHQFLPPDASSDQRGDDYWYGYRRVDGKLHNVYVGRTSQLTQKKLRETADKLHNKILTSLERDAQRRHPEQPPPARLKTGESGRLTSGLRGGLD